MLISTPCGGELRGENAQDNGFGRWLPGLETGDRAKKSRYVASSSHHLPIVRELILSRKFAFIQIPSDFVDTQSEKQIIGLATGVNLGIIAVKPM